MRARRPGPASGRPPPLITTRHSRTWDSWPAPLLRFASVNSTQDLARKLAEEGAAEWTLVWAESQRRGRGRMGRRWSSPKGGLYFSVVLRPPIEPRELGALNRVAAESVASSLARTAGVETRVKPPNDVLARARGGAGPYRKAAGILLEASGGESDTHWAVLGVGVNVNNRPPRRLARAGSLADLAGRRLELEPLLRGLLRELRGRYGAFVRERGRGR